jgi:hypothetical protein
MQVVKRVAREYPPDVASFAVDGTALTPGPLSPRGVAAATAAAVPADADAAATTTRTQPTPSTPPNEPPGPLTVRVLFVRVRSLRALCEATSVFDVACGACISSPCPPLFAVIGCNL